MIDERLSQLQEIGSDYIRSQLFRPKPKVVKYDSNYLQFGRKSDGRIFYLDLTEGFRMLIGGGTRSGKTFTMRAFADRLVQVGRSCVFLSDIKNEMWTSRFGLQKKFHKSLMDGETPKPMKVVSFRPTFFKQLSNYDSLPQHDGKPINYWYSFDLKKFTPHDFFTFMNQDEMTSPQKIILDMLYRKFESWVKTRKENEMFSWKLFDRFLDEIEDITDTQRSSMRMKFQSLPSTNFYDPMYERDIVKMMSLGYVPAFNLDGYDSFPKGGFSFVETYLSVTLRDIIKGRKDKKIPRVTIFIDEAPRFIGVDRNTSFRMDVSESVDRDTAYGVDYVMGTQSISKIPENIVRQCRYILLPATCDIHTIEDALKSVGLLHTTQGAYNEAAALKRRMRIENHDWLVIDRMRGTRDIVTPLPPLSQHCESVL